MPFALRYEFFYYFPARLASGICYVAFLVTFLWQIWGIEYDNVKFSIDIFKKIGLHYVYLKPVRLCIGFCSIYSLFRYVSSSHISTPLSAQNGKESGAASHLKHIFPQKILCLKHIDKKEAVLGRIIHAFGHLNSKVLMDEFH